MLKVNSKIDVGSLWEHTSTAPDLIILFFLGYILCHISWFYLVITGMNLSLRYIGEDSWTLHFAQCQQGLTLIMIFSKSGTAEAHLCRVHLNS